jgi:hypothetical protein
METKTLAAALLIVGLILGFAFGQFTQAPKIDNLKTQVNELTGKVAASQNLENQVAELKTQLDKLSVNELYGLVKIGDAAKAYRIGDLNKMPPVVVNDNIGNTPVVVSWCPLCGTLTVYKSTVNGKTLTFEQIGAMKIPGTEIENLHLKDKETGSIWAQGPGLAVEGQLKGTELESVSVQLFNEKLINQMGAPVWK